jgi:ABC-2 type transport system permease protein
MTTPSNVMQESQVVERLAAGKPARPLYWSLRREIWGNRSIYIVPLVAAAFYLGAFVLHTILLRLRRHGAWPLDPESQHDMFGVPYEMAAGLIMGSAFLVGVFYSLDALYGERRDRSILFWKSMPVSDLTTVLAKVAVPIAILPLLSFAITIVTQTLMLLLSSLVLLGSGVSIATLWAHASVFQFSGILLYHIVTVHGLWYAPMYGWLLFVSAWAPRAPFIWAFLPPFLLGGLEMATFNTNHFFQMLMGRLAGPQAPTPHNGSLMSAMTSMTPLQFFIEPGLWIGLAIAAAFIAVAVRLRRSRVPL